MDIIFLVTKETQLLLAHTLISINGVGHIHRKNKINKTCPIEINVSKSQVDKKNYKYRSKYDFTYFLVETKY